MVAARRFINRFYFRLPSQLIDGHERTTEEEVGRVPQKRREGTGQVGRGLRELVQGVREGRADGRRPRHGGQQGGGEVRQGGQEAVEGADREGHGGSRGGPVPA